MIAYIKCGMSLPLIILSLLSTWRVGRDSLVPSCGLGLGAGLRLRCRDDRGSHDGTGNMKTMPRAGVHGARWWIFNTVVCKPSIYTTLSSYGQSNGPSLVDFLQWCHCSLAWLLIQILLCESPPRPLCVWKWLLVKTMTSTRLCPIAWSNLLCIQVCQLLPACYCSRTRMPRMNDKIKK